LKNFINHLLYRRCMNDIPNILEPKEKVIYDGKPLYAPYIISSVLMVLIFGVMLGVVAGIFLKSVIVGIFLSVVIIVSCIIFVNMAYNRTHYAITNKRAIIQSGVIGRDFRSVDYDRMQNVSVDVGILGVIFKVGTVKIYTGELETVGSGKTSRIQAKYDKFEYVTLPYEVLKKLQTELSKRKEALA